MATIAFDAVGTGTIANPGVIPSPGGGAGVAGKRLVHAMLGRNAKIVSGQIALSNSYPTGGEDISQIWTTLQGPGVKQDSTRTLSTTVAAGSNGNTLNGNTLTVAANGTLGWPAAGQFIAATNTGFLVASYTGIGSSTTITGVTATPTTSTVATGGYVALLSDVVAGPTSPITVGNAQAGGAIPVGAQPNYMVTYVSAYGLESAVGFIVAAGNATTTGNQTYNLSTIPTGPNGIAKRRVYRTKLGASANYQNFYRVTEIADNTTTTYIDTAADTALGNPVVGGQLASAVLPIGGRPPSELLNIDGDTNSTYFWVFDYFVRRIKVYSALGTEVSNATNLAALIPPIHFMAFGYSST